MEHNKNLTTDADVFYHTNVELDVEGNLRTVTDARDNMVMQYKYDMLGNKVWQNSMDAGQRWLLINIVGNPLRTWDERDHEFQYFYDILHRPMQSKVIGGDGDMPLNNVFDQIFYGETESNPELKNLRGRIVKHYDTGGLIETPAYDFKGHPLSTTRKLFKNYKTVANWIGANLTSDLEADVYTFTNETDALGRITEQTAPDGSIITPSYNEAGLLDGETVVHADPAITTVYIKDIDYNEKGQREKIVYGNDVVTQFYYDKETFRLKRLETKRQNNYPLQDWHYTFDPVGNITHIEDKNIPIVFFDNQKITGVSTYTYDALYRLIEATGRENDTALTFDSKDNWNDAPFMHQLNPGDPMAMRNYTQSYQYDAVGNILQMKHQAAGNNWTRDYNYQTANNRLISTQIGSETYNYPHHPQHGYMTAMPHLENMGWNFKEELVKTVRQRRTDGGTPETTYYQYDAHGQRIRKITENQATAGSTPTKKEERISIKGYELFKKHNGTDTGLERGSLSLMDEQHRFVMIETRNDVDDGTEKHLVRYRLHNHLGSAGLELDGTIDASVISYEEYHPYGTTAYQARNAAIKSAAKRYRFTGMERDEENGLHYHGARYYAPCLGRWTTTDPIGIGDYINLYVYVHNNPINATDPFGLWPSWRTVAIVAAVVVVAVAVTVVTAGVAGPAAAAAGSAIAGAVGVSSATAATVGTVSAVVVGGAAAGAAGSVAGEATSQLLTTGTVETSRLRDAAISGTVTGVVTAGVGAAVGAAARGTVTAARAAQAANTATQAQRAIAATSRVVQTSRTARTAVRAGGGAGLGTVAGATHETARQVAAGEDLDTGRILGSAGRGAAMGSVLAPAISATPVPRMISGAVERASGAGYRGGLSARATVQTARARATGRRYLIGRHGSVDGREVVTAATPEGPLAMHLRTGRGGSDAGRLGAGQWERFEGFLFQEGTYSSPQGQVFWKVPEGWFIKPGATRPTPNDIATSQFLGGQRITHGPSRTYQSVQPELEAAGVPVVDPTNPSSGWAKLF